METPLVDTQATNPENQESSQRPSFSTADSLPNGVSSFDDTITTKDPTHQMVLTDAEPPIKNKLAREEDFKEENEREERSHWEQFGAYADPGDLVEQWLQKQEQNGDSSCMQVIPETPKTDSDDPLIIEPSEPMEEFAIVQPVAATNESQSAQNQGNRQPVPSTKKTDPQSGVFYCPLCSFFTYSKQGFSLHLKRHTKESEIEIVQSAMMAASGSTDLAFKKSYVCHICGKQLSSKCSLARHGLVHSGLKPYRCSVCSAAFTTSGNLSRHMKIHSTAFQAAGVTINTAGTKETEESDHCCSLCGMMFKNGKGLRMHNFMIHRSKKQELALASGDSVEMKPEDMEEERSPPLLNEEQLSQPKASMKQENVENESQQEEAIWSIPRPVSNEQLRVKEERETPAQIARQPTNPSWERSSTVREDSNVHLRRTEPKVSPQSVTPVSDASNNVTFPKQFVPADQWRPGIGTQAMFGIRHPTPRHMAFAPAIHAGPRMITSGPPGTVWHPYMPLFQSNWNNYLVALQNVSRQTQGNEDFSQRSRSLQAQEAQTEQPLDLSMSAQNEKDDEPQLHIDDEEPLDLSVKSSSASSPNGDRRSQSFALSQQTSNTWVSGFQWLKSIAEMSKHKDQKHFKCTECSLSFEEVENLRLHLQTHRATRMRQPMPLDERNRLNSDTTFYHLNPPKRAMEAHFPFSSPVPNVNLFAANSCNLLPAPHTGVSVGINLPSNMSPMNFKDSDGKYQCNMCPKRFTVASTLSRHIKYHNLHRPYVCKYCDASFTYRYNCSRHMIKFHSNEKNFPCLFCSFQAGGANQLDEHVRQSHANVKKIEEPQDVPMD